MPNAREPEFIKIGDGDQEVRVTSMHVRVAKALHTALPIMICPLGRDQVGGLRYYVDWDHAPFHHRLDMLELAHIALLAAGWAIDGGALEFR